MAQADLDARVLMRVGNTRPSLQATLTDEAGEPIDLTGATVELVTTDWLGVELRREPVSVDAPASAGNVTYDWTPGDVATAGNYGLSFHIVFGDGTESDFPTGGPLDFVVAEPGTADVDPYVIGPDRVARRIGITGDALTDEIRAFLEDTIADVQADVENYLRRPIVPTRFTESAYADPTDPCGYALAFDPVVRILSVGSPDGRGLTTVSYIAGLTNPIAQRAISRYVSGAAVEEFRAHPVYGKNYRTVRSLSAGKQSITFETAAAVNRRSSAQLPAYPQPGAMPSIETLAQWRRRGVFSRTRYVGRDATEGGSLPYQGRYALGEVSSAGDGLFVGDPRTGEIFPA